MHTDTILKEKLCINLYSLVNKPTYLPVHAKCMSGLSIHRFPHMGEQRSDGVGGGGGGGDGT